LNSTVSWVTRPIWRRNEASVKPAMSRPLIRTAPEAGS